MTITRREFGRQAARTTAAGLLLRLGTPPLLAQQEVELQPFAAQVARLLLALEAVGERLLPTETESLRRAMEMSQEANGVAAICAVLDTRVLLEVTINPENRISVRRGADQAELVQGGWRTFLVKVRNEAHTTAPLVIRSPQGGPMGRKSSLAITGVHDFTNGAVDEVEARARWIALAGYDLAPMTPAMSGLALEYRILQLYSRDAGNREASLQADAGLGEQDLGFRSTLPVLFRCVPANRVLLSLRDERGAPCTVSLLITDKQGRVYPSQGKRGLPDLAFEPQIYRSDGEFLELPAGTYSVISGRGPEYLRQRVSLAVSGAGSKLPVRLERWVEPSKFGYYSGDTHIHAAGCSHYESPAEGVTPEVMMRQVAGEALDLGSVLNWGPGFEYQKQFFSGHVQPHASRSGEMGIAPHHHGPLEPAQENETPGAAQSSALLRYDVEVSGFPSSHCGHLVLLRLENDRYPGAATIDEWPSWNLPILKWAKAQGAVTGYAHAGHGLVVDSTKLPNYLMPPFNSMGANEFLVDITHPGVIDFISGCDLWPFAELNVWYHTLNCGYLSAFAGETDFPCLTDECVGGGRTYARLEGGAPKGDEGYNAWLAALVAGDAYFGDGRSHIFDFAVQSAGAGKTHSNPVRHGTLKLDEAQPLLLSARVSARLEPEEDAETRAIASASPYSKPYWHLERARIAGTRRVAVDLIVNGKAEDRTEILADGSVQPVRFRFTPGRSSWFALRILPSSHTNPVFVEIAGKPVRASRRSAEWCRRAVDVCWEQKRTRIRPSESAAATVAYDHARAAYDLIISEAATD